MIGKRGEIECIEKKVIRECGGKNIKSIKTLTNLNKPYILNRREYIDDYKLMITILIIESCYS